MAKVGSILGISELDPACLVPYEVGREPVRERSVVRAARMRAAEADARLGEYEMDAQAGVTDRYIANAARLSRTQVQGWRSRAGIPSKPGRPSTVLHLAFQAVNVFGRGRAAPMRTRTSGLSFEPPEYVLRVPLDYDLFTRAVGQLNRDGMAPGSIAAALGVRPRDVAYVLERQARGNP